MRPNTNIRKGSPKTGTLAGTKRNRYQDRVSPRGSTTKQRKQISIFDTSVIFDMKLSLLQEKGASEDFKRYRKDILKPGKWVTSTLEGPRYWRCTLQDLQLLVECFNRAKQKNNTFNLCWGHGDPSTGIVDPRDIITPIENLELDASGTLWCDFQIRKDQAAKYDLSNPGLKVSVRVARPWMSGTGEWFPMMLLHVAIVDLPVMQDQQRFVELSQALANLSLPLGRGLNMLDLQTIVDAFNELLAPFGIKFPDSVTEENFADVLDMVLNMWRAQNGQTDSSSTDPNAPPADPNAGSTDPNANMSQHADLSQKLDMILKDNASMKQQIFDLSQGMANSKKTAFDSAVDRLGAAGNIDAKMVLKLKGNGPAWGYNVELLAPFGETQIVDMGQRAKGFAQSKAPGVNGQHGGRPSADAIKAGALELGAKY